jgi:hypothetical protein
MNQIDLRSNDEFYLQNLLDMLIFNYSILLYYINMYFTIDSYDVMIPFTRL